MIPLLLPSHCLGTSKDAPRDTGGYPGLPSKVPVFFINAFASKLWSISALLPPMGILTMLISETPEAKTQNVSMTCLCDPTSPCETLYSNILVTTTREAYTR